MPEKEAMNNTSPSGQEAGSSTEIPTTAGPLVKFHRFPDLPPELRAKIWEFACFVPRVIDVSLPLDCDDAINLMNDPAEEDYGYEEDEAMRLLFDDETSNAQSRWEKPFSTITARVAPPVLHATRESRREALQHYTVTLGRTVKTSINGATLELTYPAKTYVNWKTDIIYPTDCFDTQEFAGDEGITTAVLKDAKLLSNVNRIAVSCFHLDMTLKHLLPDLSVKEVIVYLDHGLEGWSEGHREDKEECPCPACSTTNANAKYEVKFIDAGQNLKAISKKNYDNDNGVFRAQEGEKSIKITKARVEFLRDELVKNNTKPDWKAPRFEVMAMQIREKDRYFEHEQERLKRIKDAKKRSP